MLNKIFACPIQNTIAMKKQSTPKIQHLESKVVELESSNSDLKDLLASSEIATLCLTRDFRIKCFTPATK